MTQWKQINQKEFDSIKALQTAGLSAKKTSIVLNRGVNSINSVYKADTLEEHRSMQRVRRYKYNKPSTTHLDIVPEPHTSPTIVKTIKANTEPIIQLERIADALERLADAWEAAPVKKKRWVR